MKRSSQTPSFEKNGKKLRQFAINNLEFLNISVGHWQEVKCIVVEVRGLKKKKRQD